MAEATAESSYNSLEEFLDSLPRHPCKSQPNNRYYCSVCQRLNKPLALRCEYSKFYHQAQADSGDAEAAIQFIQLSGDTQAPRKPGELQADTDKDKMAFKVVAPIKTDDDYPLLELVQPKNKEIKPIEMELLEEVAIEFKLTDDEPVEVEAVEVSDLEDTDDGVDMDEIDEVMEVEAIEAEVVEDFDAEEQSEAMESFLEFKPISKKETTKPRPKPKKVSHTKKFKPKKKLSKKPMKTHPKHALKKPVKTPIKKPVKTHAKTVTRPPVTTPNMQQPVQQPVQPKLQPQPIQPQVQTPQSTTPQPQLKVSPEQGEVKPGPSWTPKVVQNTPSPYNAQPTIATTPTIKHEPKKGPVVKKVPKQGA